MKIWTLKIITVTVLKIEHFVFSLMVGLKDAEGMPNSVDPDRTAP